MANRIIKDSICESSGLSECSFFADDLYKRLITYADDYGRFNADTQIMLARLYPREMDCTTQEDLVTALIELCGVGKVSFYTCNSRKTVYGCLPRWSEHQRIRDSKNKCPDPDDTDVNDWYLQRFIPLDLRVEIIERDGFKCQICGKFITSDRDAKRLAKHGNGMYHIDHIVPVCHGGRATLENLRLTCPTCNLKKGSRISIKDILAGNEHSPQLAASCGNPRPKSNPIQSNPNPNPNPNSTAPRCDAALVMPLLGEKEFPIFPEMVSEWAELYPAVDIMQELRNMIGWCKANPKKRKTEKGVLRFIASWLEKTQNSGGSKRSAHAQRESDFVAIAEQMQREGML